MNIIKNLKPDSIKFISIIALFFCSPKPCLCNLDYRSIYSVFHYVPLHSSPAGMKYGRVHGNLEITNNLSDRLLRLPLWPAMNPDLVVQVIAGVGAYF